MELTNAIELIENNIKEKLVHEDYERVTELADKYKRLITGEDIAELMYQFVRREDDEMFEQRCRLTQAITPAIASSIRNPYYKVSRNDKIVKRIDVKNEAKKQAVEDMLDRFYGNSPDINGLDHYMQTRFLELTFCDPNSWVVVEFSQFDERKQYPQPYPFEVSAHEAVNYSISNEVLQWLLVRNDIMYPTIQGYDIKNFKKTDFPKTDAKVEYKEGFKFTLYDRDVSVVYRQVDIAWLEQTNYEFQPGEELVILDDDNKEAYIRTSFEPKIGYAPAFRVGYNRDLYTNGRTFVNPFHAAMPFFMKSVKSVSELDLTMTLHAFPQKIQYVSKCQGTREKPCMKGYCGDGHKCDECGGSGFKVHTSAQDGLYLPMPDDKQDMLDLSNIIHYAAPPADLIKFQSEFVDGLEEKAHKAVFNSTVFVKTQVAQTATEKEMDMDSVYDTLLPFSKQYSNCWKFFARVAIVLADVNEPDANAVHAFPADFKLKTVSLLVSELKNMSESNAPSFVKDSINSDLATLIYNEDALGLIQFKTKQRFFPFNGKTMDEIQFLLSTEYVPEFNKILYANFETIFTEIDKEDKTFWYKSFDDQWKQVGDKVNAIIEDLQQGAADRFAVAQDLFATNNGGDATGEGAAQGAQGNGGKASANGSQGAAKGRFAKKKQPVAQ